ncbi:GNAT family N-acetyltransferase [Streptomyces sp. NPDC005498]|uniref:GNAT family N-acetyltransferase n=1 Tax=Streptomyces sp. NPDC005498 TaxID=3364717 RepID=UPI00369B83A6
MVTSNSVGEFAAHAWLDVMTLAQEVPGGRYERTGPSTALYAMGTQLAGVNGVADVAETVRAAELAPVVRRAAAELDVPWSIQLRAEPNAEVADLAAEHGLTARSVTPFMVRELSEAPTPPAPLPEGLVVRPAGGGDSARYIAALAAGFEAPEEVMAPLGGPQVLDLPRAAGYLAEVDGAVVATALALQAGDCVGVFNVSVPPSCRRRGYGRAVTAAVLRDARSRGARIAFLHSSPAGLSVYESLGFRTVEQWTYFTA